MSSIELCALCGVRSATTQDHVISKGLFPDGYIKKNLVTVPACEECNGGYSDDEEFFIAFLVNSSADRSKAAEALLHGKLKRSIQKAPGKGFVLQSRLELVLMRTGAGILVPMTKINIPPEDWKRYHRVLDKYARGLFYQYNGVPLPDGMVLKHVHIQDPAVLTQEILDTLSWNKDHHEVYLYGYAKVPETSSGVSVVVLYENIAFATFILSKEEVAVFEKRGQTSTNIQE